MNLLHGRQSHLLVQWFPTVFAHDSSIESHFYRLSTKCTFVSCEMFNFRVILVAKFSFLSCSTKVMILWHL